MYQSTVIHEKFTFALETKLKLNPSLKPIKKRSSNKSLHSQIATVNIALHMHYFISFRFLNSYHINAKPIFTFSMIHSTRTHNTSMYVLRCLHKQKRKEEEEISWMRYMQRVKIFCYINFQNINVKCQSTFVFSSFHIIYICKRWRAKKCLQIKKTKIRRE